jgi:23S rRNA (cytidine1920-2'-O)/16S rRNA (cytidine1409-2'-O)-methyltransferase
VITRLDLALVTRGLARSRAQAQSLIASGAVMINNVVADRPSVRVAGSDVLQTVADHYVSRGAHKLTGALDDLGLAGPGFGRPGSRRALDAGASTGGFTQILLERGWSRVYAIDVGRDQLAGVLREDPRVVVHEQTNLRDLGLAYVDGIPVDLVVADVSFISLTLLVGPLASVTRPDGQLLLMVKPQFEVGRQLLGKGGVVRDPTLQRQAVKAVRDTAAAHGWFAQRCVPSRLPGPAGNREFFVLLERRVSASESDLDRGLELDL